MARKVAILDIDDQMEFLNNAKDIVDQVRGFMPLRFGMHNENMRRLQAGNPKTKGDRIVKEGVPLIAYTRAKNKVQRREFLSEHQARVIWNVVKRGKLKISNQAFAEVFEYMGESIESNYATPPITMYTLRKTFILNTVREFWDDPDRWEKVPKKAGCTRDVVVENYMDLEQWMELDKKEFQKAPDWSTFKFMEY